MTLDLCFAPTVPNSEELGVDNVQRDLTLMKYGTPPNVVQFLFLDSQVADLQANGWVIVRDQKGNPVHD